MCCRFSLVSYSMDEASCVVRPEYNIKKPTTVVSVRACNNVLFVLFFVELEKKSAVFIDACLWCVKGCGFRR